MKVCLNNPVDAQYTALAEIPGGLGLWVEEGDLSPSTHSLRITIPVWIKRVCAKTTEKGVCNSRGTRGWARVSQVQVWCSSLGCRSS